MLHDSQWPRLSEAPTAWPRKAKLFLVGELFQVSTRRITVLSLLAWLPLLASSIQAQPPRRDIARFEGMREAFSELPHRDILELLHHPPIREHLGIKEEDVQAIEKKAKQGFDLVRELMIETRDQELTKTEFKELLLEKLTPLGDEQFQLIRDHYGEETFTKLVGLFVQTREISAAANGEVAKRIELSGDALSKFRQVRRKVWEEGRDDMRREIRRILESQSQDVGAEMSRIYRKYEHKRNAKLTPLLSPAQRAALDELKGEPFADLPKRGIRPPDGRRPGGGPRPGGPRGPGRPGAPPEDRNECPDDCPDQVDRKQHHH